VRGLSPASRRVRSTMGAPPGGRKAPALHGMIAIFRKGGPARPETSPEMWTREKGFEQNAGNLALARTASYVTISSPKTIRELSHVD
jgi:hypothetical protein